MRYSGAPAGQKILTYFNDDLIALINEKLDINYDEDDPSSYKAQFEDAVACINWVHKSGQRIKTLAERNEHLLQGNIERAAESSDKIDEMIAQDFDSPSRPFRAYITFKALKDKEVCQQLFSKVDIMSQDCYGGLFL